ncbi:hypothetical protein [Cupriavidus sp. D384]|uniref:hypothetical protein n=1 Tax=Cupriavidus sp. D384 TaxID=1538095 RepID=UPI000AD2D558|nr:hypothetical protein [Cupriavidus sp. D384]
MIDWRIGVRILISIAAVLLIAVFGATSGKFAEYDRNAMASWLQAIGSIGAILGAIWVVRYQGDLALRARRQAFLAVAEAAKTRADDFAALLEGKDARQSMTVHFHQSIIDGLVGALSAMPVHELNSRESVIAMLTIRDQVVFLGNSIRTLVDGAWKHPEMRPVLEEARDGHPGEPKDLRPLGEMVREFERVLADNALNHVNLIRENYDVLVREA